jgi:hypothetical protein
LFAVRDGTNELLGKRLFFKPDLGWMVKCPKRESGYPITTEVLQISDEGIEAIGKFPE